MKRKVTGVMLSGFAEYLREDEKSEATIEKYRRDAAAFAEWLGGRLLSKEEALHWKAELLRQYSPATDRKSVV